MIVYGIKNCDTVKKALTWLKDQNLTFEFHDYKAKGISADKLREWSKQVGWETLLNKKGATWRQLDEETKKSLNKEEQAIDLMMGKTSVIKRPLIEKAGKVILVGYNEADYLRMFPINT